MGGVSIGKNIGDIYGTEDLENPNFQFRRGSITVEPRATTRLPDLNQLDSSLRRAFRFGNKVYSSRFDAYNLLNKGTITGRTTTLGSNYLRVNSIQRGAMLKLGMNVDF